MMVFDDMLRVLSGQLPEDEFVSPLSATCMYYAIIMGSGFLFRLLNQMYSPPSIRHYLADFSTTLEMCAYFLENAFIYRHYGAFWLFVAIVIESLVTVQTSFGACDNPLNPFARFWEGRLCIHLAFLHILVHTLAAFASFNIARTIWSLDMVPEHRYRFQETDCKSDLKTTLAVGFLVEMAAAAVEIWIARQTISSCKLLDDLLKIANASFMVILGIEVTGMYLNPAMASAHTLGCEGTSVWEHVIVYWIGPLLGCLAAVEFDKKLHINVISAYTKRSAKRI